MARWSEAELYRRGARTLASSWEAYAASGRGAAVAWFPGVVVAVFPNDPERQILNNALLDRDIDARGRADALNAMEAAYAAAGVSDFAAWVHESDPDMGADLRARGYAVSDLTRAMGIDLQDIRLPRPAITLAPPRWPDVLRIAEIPPGFGGPAGPDGFAALIAVSDGTPAATVATFDHAEDCGIYTLATLPHARRQGLGSALATLAAHEARARGCLTATLQATPMAEKIYAALGFRDLGLIQEYAKLSFRSPHRASSRSVSTRPRP
jgi:GNAT superfamily N-acetyltransferase